MQVAVRTLQNPIALVPITFWFLNTFVRICLPPDQKTLFAPMAHRDQGSPKFLERCLNSPGTMYHQVRKALFYLLFTCTVTFSTPCIFCLGKKIILTIKSINTAPLCFFSAHWWKHSLTSWFHSSDLLSYSVFHSLHWLLLISILDKLEKGRWFFYHKSIPSIRLDKKILFATVVLHDQCCSKTLSGVCNALEVFEQPWRRRTYSYEKCYCIWA